MVEQETHEELTAQQEDYLLEQAREEYFERKQAIADRDFEDYKTFNLTELKKDYAKDKDINFDGTFEEYCLEAFKFEYNGDN